MAEIDSARLRTLIEQLGSPGPLRNAAAKELMPIVALMVRRAMPRDRDVHDDVTQKVLIRLMTIRLDHVDEPAAYLATMVRNLARDHWRRRPREIASESAPEAVAEEALLEPDQAELDVLRAGWQRVRERVLARRSAPYREGLARDLDDLEALVWQNGSMDALIQRERSSRADVGESTARNRIAKRHERARDAIFQVIDEMEAEGGDVAVLRRLALALYRCHTERARRVRGVKP